MPIDSYIHKAVTGIPGGPLTFTFHGTGGDENQFPRLARDMLPAATIISPRGDVSEHGAARFFRRTSEGVYDMTDLARATAKMAEFVRAHVETVKPSSVFGLGYSNGANILASVIFAAPDLFDAAVLMHPLIPFEPAPAGLVGKRVLVTAGRRDPICPPELTTRLISHLQASGSETGVEWHDGGHEVRESEIEAIRAFLASAGNRGVKA